MYPDIFMRKGLGPIISSILLITIVVSVSTVVFFWSNSLGSNIKTTLEDITKTKISCQRSGFYIQDFSFNCYNTTTKCNPLVNKNFTFRATNTGDNGVGLKSFYARNSSGDIFEFNISYTLNAGEIKDFAVQTGVSCAGIAGSISEVIVTSGCAGLYDVYTGPFSYMNCV